jgi:hypothetical protein
MYEENAGYHLLEIAVTNITCNGKPILKVYGASFEGYSLGDEYIYFNDGAYHIFNCGYH